MSGGNHIIFRSIFKSSDAESIFHLKLTKNQLNF